MNSSPPWLAPRAAYLHVPFCAHQCGYCDFAVVAGRDHDAALYVEALGVEMASAGEPRPVETIFLGGGTPTQISPALLDRLLAAIRRWFPPAPGLSGYREFTVESTPESLSPETVAVLADGGVTRVSVGVQSFSDRTLAALDRQHRAADIPRALDAVRRRFDDFSLDLIFAVPGSTLDDWAADLDAALAHAPQHISTYGLTFEKTTPLGRQQRGGQVQPLAEDDELAMYLLALDRFAAAGLRHYEVSNHARPGHESAHNHVYWANHAHWGLGLGAAQYAGGLRTRNTRRFDDYLRKTLAGESAIVFREQLSDDDRARETISTQLRRSNGIDRTQFRDQTGRDLDALAGPALRELTDLKLLSDDGQRVAWTRAGVCVIDSVIARLMG